MGRNKLIIAQALLFALVIIFIGLIVINEKLPVLKEEQIKNKITNYYNQKYHNNDVTAGKLIYNQEEKSYSITYTNNKYNNLSFTITYHQNQITDNYETNYLKGKEIINKAEEKVKEKYEEALKNTYYKKITVTFDTLNSYEEKTKIDILNDNIYDTSYYDISFYIEVPTLDETYLNNLIQSFMEIEKNNNLKANNYNITLNNNGIIKLIKVTKGGIIYE